MKSLYYNIFIFPENWTIIFRWSEIRSFHGKNEPAAIQISWYQINDQIRSSITLHFPIKMFTQSSSQVVYLIFLMYKNYQCTKYEKLVNCYHNALFLCSFFRCFLIQLTYKQFEIYYWLKSWLSSSLLLLLSLISVIEN